MVGIKMYYYFPEQTLDYFDTCENSVLKGSTEIVTEPSSFTLFTSPFENSKQKARRGFFAGFEFSFLVVPAKGKRGKVKIIIIARFF